MVRTMRFKNKRATWVALPAAVLLGLTACGGDTAGSSNDDSPEAEETAAEVEENGGDESSSGDLTPLTVGLIPIVDVAPVFIGIEQGFFADHGLEIKPEMADGGAAIVPAVTSNSYQVGFSNNVSLIIGVSRDLPVELVAAGVGISPESRAGHEDAGYCTVVSGPDSGIESVADLSGQTIAVNTINNIGDVTIRAALEAEGVDTSTVSFSQMGFAEMPAAIDSGSLKAGWLCEPFVTTAIDGGAKPILNNYSSTDENLGVASYFVASDWASENPDLVSAFQDAIRESMAYAQENPDAVRAAILEYTRVDEDTAERIGLPDFPTEFNEGSLQKLIDLSEADGLLGGPVTLEDLLHRS